MFMVSQQIWTEARYRGAKSVENHLVDLLILFRVVIYLFILYDLPTNTV